ncbi:uncharacterized protein LOC106668392 [Cimex lectularius]|uniref:Insulin receptor substrate 1 n=1 Tax=Cimex lectularius TaxID=79782 RepID=A0A8I6SVG6_CIMLE|nr:uncharacterized protein LOC106668392 [Cimex lectularius]
MTDSVCASPARSINHDSMDSGSECEGGSVLLTEVPGDPDQTILTGYLKFRDYKRWKPRYGVVTKLSPAADCLHLQLYRDSKDRYKQGQTKASLSLQHFLGVETGFTLDKESNTIAILCQDVTVVLAFDTRERLIQWQVKIANNLGEDQQFLVQISSAPSKAKIAPGPARLHVQEHRFCMTLGVPPRLIGIWEISKLRRYGVVEARFCFEGGSRCGKGEGLYVMITDQGEEITRTLQAASEGKLASRRRPASRNMSVMDSPRKCSTRMSSIGGDTMSLCQRSIADTMDCQSVCPSVCPDGSSIWPSSETRTDVSDLGDTASVGDFHDHKPQECGGWNIDRGIGRCASCISKLGAMSRSSTAANTPGGAGLNPAWVMDSASHGGRSSVVNCSAMSVSSHDSGSDYSVPRVPPNDCWSFRGTSPCECEYPPTRPPKPAEPSKGLNISNNQRHTKKPPMPLPNQTYGNYDVPKTIFPQPIQEEECTPRINPSEEHYDTPKAIKECLAYSNYDTPQMVNGSSGNRCFIQSSGHCIIMTPRHHQTRVVLEEDTSCPCRRLVCWPSNWISLPYCKRGAGIENTSVHLHKVKLNGEGKMPVMNKCGELAIYATIDKTKKTKHKKDEDDIREKEDKEQIDGKADEGENNCNYVNIEPEVIQKESTSTTINYENLDFAQSLEYYENSKDVLIRAGLNKEVPGYCTDKNGVKFCTKCGHACSAVDNKSDDYLMMEPQLREKPAQSKFPGYLPMQPTVKSELRRLGRGLNDKSASIPSLIDKRRNESETRIPGSALMRLNYPQSANSSPYLRRHAMACRKRSSSVDSARYDSEEAVPKPGEEDVDQNSSISVSQHESAVSIHVRRSSSVPCKPSNRDSSSSNDSGVSTGSLKHRGADFAEFELPLTTSMSGRRLLLTQALHASHESCLHASLPRRSKSSDPLKELSFQFSKVKVPAKSSSAEAEIPICHGKREPKEYSPNGDGAIIVPYIDSRSTSSGTSDMSDYIETLSMSSHSSSDTPESLRLGRVAVTTLRPRSGKEYHKIDRYIIEGDIKGKVMCTGITTVPEKSESPSPGYISSSPAN